MYKCCNLNTTKKENDPIDKKHLLVWLQHLVNSLDSISNQKLRLAFWIIDHLDRENQLIMTQRAIADATNMSTKTVNTTLKALCEAPEGSPAFLQRINSGAYRVNPEVIFKGSHSNRMGICYEYKETDTKQQDETVQELINKLDAMSMNW